MWMWPEWGAGAPSSPAESVWGSAASREVKGEVDFLWVLFPSPAFYSLSLLSQLPSVSFDVYCWDFKRTLSTWAGVAFSEQARVPRSSVAGREVGPTHSFRCPSPRAAPGHASGSWSWERGSRTWWSGGCTTGLSPLIFKACWKGSVFLQSCWRDVV